MNDFLNGIAKFFKADSFADFLNNFNKMLSTTDKRVAIFVEIMLALCIVMLVETILAAIVHAVRALFLKKYNISDSDWDEEVQYNDEDDNLYTSRMERINNRKSGNNRRRTEEYR